MDERVFPGRGAHVGGDVFTDLVGTGLDCAFAHGCGLESERGTRGIAAVRFFGWHVGNLQGEAQKRYAVKLRVVWRGKPPR